MTGLPSLRYPQSPTIARPTAWARGWRLRWHKEVGSLHQHHATRELVAFYSDDREPSARLALQSELESRGNGVAQVLAELRRVQREWNHLVTASDQKHRTKKRPKVTKEADRG